MAPSHIPVRLAQTSPLSPFGPATCADEAFLFAAAAWNLEQYARQFELASASDELSSGGVLVFPEYGLQGIIADNPAYALPAPYLVQALQALCKQYRLAAVTTIVEPFTRAAHPSPPPTSPFPRSASDGALQPPTDAQRREWEAYVQAMAEVDEKYELINVAYYVSAEGDVVGRYEKANLWHPERDYLRAGSEPSAVFDTPWGKAGLVICWDLSHPEAVQSLVRRGAEIVFAPTYWLSTDSDPIQRKYTPTAPLYDHILLPSLAFIRAFEGECLLIMGNPGVGSPSSPSTPTTAVADSPLAKLEAKGREIIARDNTYDNGFFGQSGVWAPLAGKVGDAGVDEGSWSGKVGLEVIQDARKTYKIVEEAHLRVDAKPTGA